MKQESGDCKWGKKYKQEIEDMVTVEQKWNIIQMYWC